MKNKAETHLCLVFLKIRRPQAFCRSNEDGSACLDRGTQRNKDRGTVGGEISKALKGDSVGDAESVKAQRLTASVLLGKRFLGCPEAGDLLGIRILCGKYR